MQDEICKYCGEKIKSDEPSVDDEWGDIGDKLHLCCSIDMMDGDHLDD